MPAVGAVQCCCRGKCRQRGAYPPTSRQTHPARAIVVARFGLLLHLGAGPVGLRIPVPQRRRPALWTSVPSPEGSGVRTTWAVMHNAVVPALTPSSAAAPAALRLRTRQHAGVLGTGRPRTGASLRPLLSIFAPCCRQVCPNTLSLRNLRLFDANSHRCTGRISSCGRIIQAAASDAYYSKSNAQAHTQCETSQYGGNCFTDPQSCAARTPSSPCGAGERNGAPGSR